MYFASEEQVITAAAAADRDNDDDGDDNDDDDDDEAGLDDLSTVESDNFLSPAICYSHACIYGQPTVTVSDTEVQPNCNNTSVFATQLFRMSETSNPK